MVDAITISINQAIEGYIQWGRDLVQMSSLVASQHKHPLTEDEGDTDSWFLIVHLAFISSTLPALGGYHMAFPSDH